MVSAVAILPPFPARHNRKGLYQAEMCQKLMEVLGGGALAPVRDLLDLLLDGL